MSEEYEIPSSFLKRLILKDNSDAFSLYINIVSKEATKIVNFKTTINKARVISKKINETYEIDPTIYEYEFDLPSTFLTSEESSEDKIIYHLQQIQKSITEKVEIEKEDIPLFNKLLYLLGNIEESNDQFEITSTKEAISLLFTKFHHNSIEYLALHLKEASKSGDLEGIGDEIVFDIIDFHFLKGQNENDEIFESMKNHDERNSVIMHFLLQIESGYSSSMVEYITENLDDEVIENERSQIVRMIVRQLHGNGKKQEKEKKVKKKNDKIVSCEFNGNELGGIISYLERTTNCDIDKSGTLKLSGGGSQNLSYPLTNIIKYDPSHINDYYFNYSGSKPTDSESWIQFDFGERRVNLTSYTLRTNFGVSNSNYHSKTWRIAGSNDGSAWDVIDRRASNSSLNGRYQQNRFECSKTEKYYRYIRYIQEDSWNSGYQSYISMTCVEFFGSLLLP